MSKIAVSILYDGLKDELERALGCNELAYLLNGRMGALPKKYWFINKCINNHPVVSIGISCSKSDYKLNHAIYLLQSIFRSKDKNQIDLLIVTRNRFISKLKNQGEKKDYLFSSIIDEIKQDNTSIKMANLIMDIKCPSYTNVPNYSALGYLGLMDVLKSIIEVIIIIYLWHIHKTLIGNYLRENDCNFIASQLSSFFSVKELIKYALIGASIENLIDTKRPKLILSNDDIVYSKFATKYDKYISLVLQSANLHSKKECCKSLLFADSSLLPDYLLLSGEAFKKALDCRVAKKYIVTGQPRYDEIFKFNTLNNIFSIKQRLGLNIKDNVILWATQLLGSNEDENVKTINAIFKTINYMKNITLVIKQHPGEEEIHTKLILDNILNYRINYQLVPKNSNINELLYVCDLLITKDSSTCREAVLFAKPVLIFDLSEKPLNSEYIDEGVASGVYNENDLGKTIISLLNNNSKFTKNREAYINNYLYKNDGLATARVVNLIRVLINAVIDKQKSN